MIGDFVAGFSEVRSDQRRGFFFLRGELGIFVEMFVGGQKRVGFLVDALVQIILREEAARRCRVRRQEKARLFGLGNALSHLEKEAAS